MGLRSSAIACPYCLQFGHAIVRGSLWGPPSWVGVQIAQELLGQVAPMRDLLIIACPEVWESGKKWFSLVN
jgi:hypothetical protein